MSPLQHPASSCGSSATVKALIQPHAEGYSLMFTDVECTHYIGHNPINKHVFHPHYINPDPINKQTEQSELSKISPAERELLYQSTSQSRTAASAVYEEAMVLLCYNGRPI